MPNSSPQTNGWHHRGFTRTTLKLYNTHSAENIHTQSAAQSNQTEIFKPSCATFFTRFPTTLPQGLCNSDKPWKHDWNTKWCCVGLFLQCLTREWIRQCHVFKHFASLKLLHETPSHNNKSSAHSFWDISHINVKSTAGKINRLHFILNCFQAGFCVKIVFFFMAQRGYLLSLQHKQELNLFKVAEDMKS